MTSNDVLLYINDITNENIKKQLIIINKIIDKNHYIYKNIFDKEYNKNSLFHCELNYINCNNIFNNNKDKKISINNKISPIRYKKYYILFDDEYLFNSYQCYLKSSIYFFLNNGDFIKNIIEFQKNKIKNNKFINLDIIDINNIDNIDDNNLLNNDIVDSDIIHTDKYINGGGLNDIVIENINKQMIDILIDVRNYLNIHYNNKYLLCIPGIKVYPSIVINDLLQLENNIFSQKCFFKLDNNNCGYIYDLTKDLSSINIYYIVYKLLTNLNYKYLNIMKQDNNFLENILINNLNKYIPNNQNIIFNTLIKHKFIDLPNNLLFHCPIYDSHEIYMINNVCNIMINSKIKIYYSTIKKMFNCINNYLNIHIIYPYNIEIQNIIYIHLLYVILLKILTLILFIIKMILKIILF